MLSGCLMGLVKLDSEMHVTLCRAHYLVDMSQCRNEPLKSFKTKGTSLSL